MHAQRERLVGIIILSGSICTGKSTLAEQLVLRYGARRISSRQLLIKQTEAAPEREALQKAGEILDRKTGGRWLAKALASELSQQSDEGLVVVDAVRIERQIEAIRNAFGSRVTHVHLSAPEEVLAKRYAQRPANIKEFGSYEEVRASRTERGVEKLKHIADLVIDTHKATKESVLVRVAAHLGLYGRGVERVVDVLVGGQYGSEGKGHIASYLAREYDFLVRVGGPNAGHKVYEEPDPYTFHLLPSGTRAAPNAKILLGPGAVLWMDRLRKEIADCEVQAGRLFIDPQAMIIEKGDRDREAATLTKTIGSTGQGVGAATARKILRSAAEPPVRLARDIQELKPFLRDSLEVLDDAFSHGSKVLLEGTQGTGLSLHHGFYPHVTSRDTTVGGCLSEAGIAPSRVRKIIMVCRTYPIRVESPEGGTSGPMVNEISWEEISRRSGVPIEELEEKERTSTTNRKRRVSEFDWELLRKAASLNGPTDVALTFADYLSIKNRQARRFEQLEVDTVRRIEEIERVAGAPVSLIATRFHFRSIIDRRAW